MSTDILAIDPGGTTGLAWWGEDGEICTTAVEPRLHVVRVIRSHSWDLVVCEEFRLYPWMASKLHYDEMWTSRLIGMIELTCFEANLDLELVPASNKKPAFAQARKRGYDLDVYQTQHEKDAAGHLLHATYRRAK